MIRYIEKSVWDLSSEHIDLNTTYVHNKETHKTTKAGELSFAEYHNITNEPEKAYVYTVENVTEEQLEQERIEYERQMEEWRNSRKKAE